MNLINFPNMNPVLWRKRQKPLQLSHEYMCAQSPRSSPTLCHPVDCSQPGSSMHGILSARILEWVAISSSRASSRPRYWTHMSCISCIDRQVLYHWATWASESYCTLRWRQTWEQMGMDSDLNPPDTSDVAFNNTSDSWSFHFFKWKWHTLYTGLLWVWPMGTHGKWLPWWVSHVSISSLWGHNMDSPF